MQDQAHRLRRLVSRVESVEHSARGRQLVLSGCKGGVGATTVAVNLAIALCRQKQKVLLVDANPTRGDVATMLRLDAASYFEDVAEGRHTLRQVMVEGPLGIRVVPSCGTPDGAIGAKVLQLVRHLDTVALEFDWILIDAGCCPTTAELLWPTSDRVIVIGSTDFVAITDAYALIKLMSRKRALAPLATMINRAPLPGQAEEAQRRLTESCRRFLQLELVELESVPDCQDVREAENIGRPVLCSHPTSHAVQALTRIAKQIASINVEVNDFNSMLFA